MHLYPDPMYGTNMRYAGSTTDGSAGIPDIATNKQKFWYYSTVTLGAAGCRFREGARLCLDGINYMADIYINASFSVICNRPTPTLGRRVRIFIPTRWSARSKKGKFNVTGIAAAGTNYIAVRSILISIPELFITSRPDPADRTAAG